MIKRILLMLLVLPISIVSNSCNNQKKESDEEYFSHFKPILRFAVTSDVHTSSTKEGQELERFKNVYKITSEYSKTQNYNGFDYVFVNGDGADRAYDDDLNLFANAVKEQSALYSVPTQAIMGNHELTGFLQTYEECVNKYKQVMGYDRIDFHIKVKGFHFIMYSPRDTDWHYDEDNLGPWLEQQIQEALNDDPTKTKPIFVFQHFGLKDTVSLTNEYYMTRRDGNVESPAKVIPEILKKYPQVVDFSGHTHANIEDPRSVYQKDYTAISTGTLCYYVLDIKDVYSSHIFAEDDDGHYIYSPIDLTTNDDGGEFIIFEVDETGASRMMIMDANSGLPVGEPFYFRSFSSTKDFRYTSERIRNDPIPTFNNPFVSEPVITSNSVSYKVEQIKYVQNYRLNLYKLSDDQLISTDYRLSDAWVVPRPNTFEVDFHELLSDSEYRIKITPVNSWGQEGHALTLNFKTNK